MTPSFCKAGVEQEVSASICVLSTPLSQDVTQNMSQAPCVIRAYELDIEDPQLPKIQDAEHVQKVMDYRQKQNNKRKALLHKESSSKELSEMIDVNAKVIADRVKAAVRLNARKRKAQLADRAKTKKQRITLGKYRMQQVNHTEKAGVLKCFNRRGGPYGLVHTHQWWALV
ncbi:hypothetical protein PTTG_00867 [Puccinia triticina 1-1 BBBD Race 1]|uniref:Uncharacterized protein n=1 Tax=Puccinia triticina (isolate 1-1 / race 1 (BBBD)) TaxID=630390 RepID=A0A180GLN5_PUCT1|nr:hypothetical protein PTTG_00867 [Puccinia triticina 1-1 BBBD Race 1]